MTKICVNYSSYTDVEAEHDFGDEFSGEDTHTTHDIESVYVSNEKDYYDLNVPFDVVEGKQYYLLYGLYSTGDSFNHDSGRLQFVDLYQTIEMADANKKILEDHNKITGTKDDYTAQLLMDDGTIYPFNVPWKGYFESLESLVIETVNVAPGKSKILGGYY